MLIVDGNPGTLFFSHCLTPHPTSILPYKSKATKNNKNYSITKPIYYIRNPFKIGPQTQKLAKIGPPKRCEKFSKINIFRGKFILTFVNLGCITGSKDMSYMKKILGLNRALWKNIHPYLL